MGMGFRKSWWSVRRRRGQSGGPAGRKRIESRRDRERRKTKMADRVLLCSSD